MKLLGCLVFLCGILSFAAGVAAKLGAWNPGPDPVPCIMVLGGLFAFLIGTAILLTRN